MANIIAVTLPSADDTALIAALTGLGHTVREVDDGAAETVTMADGTTPADLIIIGPRAAPGSKYRTVTVPVIAVNSSWWGTANGGLSNAADASAVTATSVFIQDAADALSAGLSAGTQAVYSSAPSTGIRYVAVTDLGASARVPVRRLTDGQAVIFGYASGDAMATAFNAPAKRYGFGCGRYPSSWTTAGQSLFAAVVTDALTGAAPEIVADSLLFSVQPSNTDVGSTMPAVVVRAVDSTQSNATDVDFTGTVTLTPVGGSYAGTLTKAAVAGIATFDDLVPLTISGGDDFSFEADASAFDTITSAPFDVTVPTGGGVSILLESEPMASPILKNTAVAALRRIYLNVWNDDRTPWSGSVTGVKVTLNGVASTNDIVRVGGALHYAQLSQEESNTTAPVVTAVLDAATGRIAAQGIGVVTEADWTLPSSTPDAIADEVETRELSTEVTAVAPEVVAAIQSGLATDAALSAVAGYIDTEMAAALAAVLAVKTKTDALPASPAAAGDQMAMTSDAQLALVKAIVRAANGADGFKMVKDIPNSRLILTVPGESDTYIPAVFAESSPAVVSIGA